MAARALGTLVRAVADVFYPRFCIVCGAPVASDRAVDLCEACEGGLRLGGLRCCERCAAPMARYASKCPNCHNMRIAMNASTAFGVYDGALRERVIEYKFAGAQHLARTFGRLLAGAVARKWPETRIDAVTAVPLHRARRLERGFDQSREIGWHAARALGVPWRPGLLSRVRETESQVGLTRTGRAKNVKGAFAARSGGVESALVVDDIMTTGATLSEAARALKRAGVRAVYAAAVARAATSAAGDVDESGEEGLP